MTPTVSSQKSSWNGSITKGKRAQGSKVLLSKNTPVGERAESLPDRQLPLYLREIGQVLLLAVRVKSICVKRLKMPMNTC